MMVAHSSSPRHMATKLRPGISLIWPTHKSSLNRLAPNNEIRVIYFCGIFQLLTFILELSFLLFT